MVLFREVYGWMRHLLKNDPEALASGIVIQEVTPLSSSHFDTNDGARTLGIYKRDAGLACRLEVRFAGIRPHIVWVNENNQETLIDQVAQTGFPGDWYSYDCSDVCDYLLALAKDKFCKPKVLVILDPQEVKASSFKLMDQSLVLRVLDSLKLNKNRKVSRGALNKWLKDQDAKLTKGGDAFDFAHSVIHYFKKEITCKGANGSRKIDWDDIDILEDKFDPGHPIVEWSALKRWLAEPDVRGKLPPNILERVLSSSDQDAISQNKAKGRMDGWLSDYVQGRELHAAQEATVALGQGVIAGFKSGVIPLNYLTQAELADPYEKLMPWSLIRRSVIRYKAQADSCSDSLLGLIFDWLESSELLLPLYQADEAGKDALKKALEAQVNHHMDMTVRNPAWANKVLDGYVGVMPQADLVRAVQIDFDLWLFNALSPAVGEKDIPLSPYAFSAERRDQALYDTMVGCWMKCLKEHQVSQQTNFIEWLTAQLESFYAHVKNLWGKEGVENYTPHMPSVARILEAVKTGDKAELLCLLVEDMEAEAGSGLPDNIRQELLMNPFFNSIYDAVRVQSVQLP